MVLQVLLHLVLWDIPQELKFLSKEVVAASLVRRHAVTVSTEVADDLEP
jgi:hypothetical protein